jgi:cytochrome c oxidase assembly protein subunit 15
VLSALAIVALALQIVLGGLTSANFAATACRTLPDCHGGWWPGPELGRALDLTRHHEVTPSGQAIGGAERIAVHRAHRLMAVLTAALVLLTAVWAVRSGGPVRTSGIALIILVAGEFAVGVTAVIQQLPIALAVAHNWLAGLLLLFLLRLLHQSRRSPRFRNA